MFAKASFGQQAAVAGVGLPSALALDQNFPNPFNPSTTITFTLPERSTVDLVVYDAQGRRVRTLVRGTAAAGVNEVAWDGRNSAGETVASGIYFYRMRVGSDVFTRKMLLLK